MASVYIVTLAHAENTLIENKAAFGAAVESAFVACYGAAAVVFWACSREEHEAEGHHFHCSIKLARSQRFLGPRGWLQTHHHVAANFSPGGGYKGAFEYITKEDKEPALSSSHPLEVAEPRTSQATRTRSANAGRRRSRFIADEAGEGEGQVRGEQPAQSCC